MVKTEEDSKKRPLAITESDDDDDDVLLLDMTPVFNNSKRKKSPDSVTSSLKTEAFRDRKVPALVPYSVPSSVPSSQVVQSTAAVALASTPNTGTVVGTFVSVLVGCDLYKGTLVSNERFELIRDTTNEHDPNAIKALARGETQGHFPRRAAAILAPYLDNDFVSLYGHTHKALVLEKQIPITVTVSLKSASILSKAEVVAKARVLDHVLRNLAWNPSVPIAVAKRGDTSDSDKKIAAVSLSDYVETAVDTSEVGNGEIDEDKLDKLFEVIQKEQLSNLPDIEMPQQLSSMKLYDYQQNGIRWLVKQETEGRISPFFEEQGSRWFCNVSRVFQLRKPEPIRGAVLADDMGLGKTIQTLGLILLNPPRGQKGYPYVRNSTANPRTTLIVAPLSVMANWIMQIEKHINKRKSRKMLVVSKYHGPNRKSQIPLVQLNQVDILITSYNTLASDLKNLQKSPSAKSILNCTFHRTVLDEAHIIRNSKTGFFKVAQSLKTNHKLCLTGTPFVNRPEDIHSLLSFLNVEPLCNKKAFKEAISDRILNRDPVGLSTLRTSLAFIALRRNKVQVHSTIKLVSKDVIDKVVPFPSGEHKRIHDILYLATRSMFLSFLKSSGNEGIADNYMAFLELVLRVRQACCHAGLVPQERLESAGAVLDLMKHTTAKRDEGTLDPLEAENLLDILRGIDIEGIDGPKEECAVCLEVLSDDSVTILRECKHIFCETCLQNIRSQVCPMCRTPYSPDDMIAKSAAEESLKEKDAKKKESTTLKGRKKAVKYALGIGRSPKIQAMFDEIAKMKPDEKGVVFSQWTSFLDILENEFIKEGIFYTRLDGSMSADKRVENMEAFDTDGCNSFQTPRFILCSLMACGTGINLTRGNVVFLTDPWWNAACASQAMDRVHRIGQMRPVRVIRLIMEDSIETRMMALQEAKSTLGKGSLQKLQQDEKRKARLMTLHQLLEVGSIEELWQ